VILEAIELSHAGPFRATVRVGPLSAGLNLVSAPNEAGKTTLIRAATRALFDRHTCRDAEIRALKPAGTDLGPKVVVQFATAAGRFRVEKAFLQGVKSLLSQWQDHRWQPLAEGDQADSRLQELLRSTQPGRGATDAAHWGFLGFLWARQGEAVQWPEWGGETGAQIKHHLARIELDPLVEALRARFGEIWSQIFTPTTGQAKAGGALKQAEDELARTETDLRALAGRTQQLEERQRDFQARSAAVQALEQEHARRVQAAAEAREAARNAETLRADLAARQQEFDSARDRLKMVSDDLAAAARHRDELTAARADLAAAEQSLAGQRTNEAALEQQAQPALKSIADLETKLDQWGAQRQRIHDLLRCRRLRQSFATLEAQAQRAGEQAARINQLAEQRARTADISPARLRKLEELDQTIREQGAQLQAVGLAVELVPDKSAQVQVREGATETTLTLAGGQAETIRAAEALELRLPEWGKIAIRSGAAELKTLRTELTEAKTMFHDRLVEAGVTTLEEARTAVASRKELEQQIRAADSVLKAHLGEFDSLAELQAKAAWTKGSWQALVESLQATGAEQEASLTDLEAQEAELQARLESQEKARRTLRQQLDQLRQRAAAAAEARQATEKQLAALTARIQGLESQLAALRQRHPQGLEPARDAAGQTFVEAEARLQSIRLRLPPDFDRLPERNRQAAAALERVQQELERQRADCAQAKGALAALGAEGLYARETELLERQTILLAQRDAALARGLAARILHDLIEFRKQSATRAVLEPLEAGLTAAFAEVTGEAERKVFLDENLQVVGIGRTREESHAFDLLSQGAKEQLLLCLRLAVARELAKHEPQVVILDDVLVNTDPQRQQRVVEVLQSAANTLQILVLTCLPERYRGLGQLAAIQLVDG
jgi:DNA repair exonuclease SbcCD ATPase subunit